MIFYIALTIDKLYRGEDNEF